MKNYEAPSVNPLGKMAQVTAAAGVGDGGFPYNNSKDQVLQQGPGPGSEFVCIPFPGVPCEE